MGGIDKGNLKVFDIGLCNLLEIHILGMIRSAPVIFPFLMLLFSQRLCVFVLEYQTAAQAAVQPEDLLERSMDFFRSDLGASVRNESDLTCFCFRGGHDSILLSGSIGSLPLPRRC